jgi:hypothetical protein
MVTGVFAVSSLKKSAFVSFVNQYIPPDFWSELCLPRERDLPPLLMICLFKAGVCGTSAQTPKKP